MHIDNTKSDHNVGCPLIDEGEMCLAGDIVQEKRVIVDILYVIFIDYKALFSSGSNGKLTKYDENGSSLL